MTATHPTPRPHRRRRAAAAAALTALAVIGSAASCASDTTDEHPTAPIPAQQWTPGATAPPPSSPARTPAAAAAPALPAGAAVDRSDADSVATAAVTLWFTWDTSADTGPNDAAARTAPLLTADYAREVTATTATTGPGEQWNDWAARGVILTPTLAADDEPVPPQTDSVAYRAYRVTQTSPQGDRVDTAAAVILRRGPSGWEVSRIAAK